MAIIDRADELHGKHTMFGRCVGDTIYSVSSIRVSTTIWSLTSTKLRCHEDRSNGYVTYTLLNIIENRIDFQTELDDSGRPL